MYAATPKLRIVALDAATGKLKWSFDPFEGKKTTSKVRNRGVTYWEDGGDRRIYFTALYSLYALDARTGKRVPGFGDEGRVDLRQGLGRDPRNISISWASPAAVYKDVLIVGSLVSEGLPSAPGDIRAYDVRTGKLRWSFHTIPHPGEFGYETWPKDGWKYLGGANNWAGMAVDETRGLVFAPTGSAAFDFYGANRHGDNLFANSLIALKAETGERVWHFQFVKHDVWDRDLPTAPNLVQVRRNGKLVDAVAQSTKSGHVFVFDRETGSPLFPVEYRKVPASEVDGEKLADTQPLPLKPPAFARQRLTEGMLTRRTPEANKAALERFRKIRSGEQFAPPSYQGTIVFPGFDGGAEWGGQAFDPETHLYYVNANEMAWILRIVDVARPKPGARTSGRELYSTHCAACHRADMAGTTEFPSLLRLGLRYTESEVRNIVRLGAGRMPAFGYLEGAAVAAITRFVMRGEDDEVAAQGPSPMDQKFGFDGYNKFLDPDGYPAVEPPWGTLNAIDLDKGKIVWRIPLGEYPALAAKGLKNTGTENYGGPIVTAGGLVFIGATNHDNKFRAFDKSNGKLLWETKLPAAGNATPATYEVNGKQYVVIAAGGGKSGAPSGGTYVAFALPDK
jgi:quinoprotein glucose dehydrogenase